MYTFLSLSLNADVTLPSPVLSPLHPSSMREWGGFAQILMSEQSWRNLYKRPLWKVTLSLLTIQRKI